MEWYELYNNKDVKAPNGKHISEYFTTDALYQSNFSLCSKVIMNDWDGDKVMTLSEHKDNELYKVAKHNVEKYDIVPLYYEMEKAKPSLITPENIYNSLKTAFGVNIGEASNSLTKVYANENPDMEVARFLTMENNFLIDAAKTLFFLERPEYADVKIREYTDMKMPYFMKFDKSKDKTDKFGHKKPTTNVANKTNSTVNKLEELIKGNNIHFKEYKGKFDYRSLLSAKRTKVDLEEDVSKAITSKYDELNKKKVEIMNHEPDEPGKKKQKYFFKYVKKELFAIHKDLNNVTDVLVKYLYEKNNPNKNTLWESFGHYLYANLLFNLKGIKTCRGCWGEIIDPKPRQQRCESCIEDREREKAKLRKQKQREKEKAVTLQNK
jgi:hypothetical protein